MSARRWPQLLPARPSLRRSVRSTSSSPPPQPGRLGPAQRRPEQPRPREETGAAPARPCPAPALLPFCPSVRPSPRPLALPSFCPATSPRARSPAPPALSLPGSLSLCLCPRAASQPLPRSPISGPPQGARLIPQSLPPLSAPHLWGSFFQNTFHTPPKLSCELPAHPLRVLPSICPPKSRGSCLLLALISSGFSLFWCPPYTLIPSRSLGVSPWDPQSSPAPRLQRPSLPSLGLSAVAVSPCSLSGLRAPHSSGSGPPALLSLPLSAPASVLLVSPLDVSCAADPLLRLLLCQGSCRTPLLSLPRSPVSPSLCSCVSPSPLFCLCRSLGL